MRAAQFVGELSNLNVSTHNERFVKSRPQVCSIPAVLASHSALAHLNTRSYGRKSTIGVPDQSSALCALPALPLPQSTTIMPRKSFLQLQDGNHTGPTQRCPASYAYSRSQKIEGGQHSNSHTISSARQCRPARLARQALTPPQSTTSTPTG
jgi:hypothetical protein